MSSSDDVMSDFYSDESFDFDEMDYDDFDDNAGYDDYMDDDEKEDAYVLMSFEDVLREQRDYINKISEIFSIASGIAKLFLINARWNVDRLVERFYNGEAEMIFEECGLNNLTVPKPVDPNKVVDCSICFSQFKYADMKAFSCQHMFCNMCWLDYIRIKINDGFVNVIKCPSRGCRHQLDEEIIEEIIGDDTDLLKKYHKFSLQSYINDNKKIRWCPGIGCDKAVKIRFLKEKYIDCECGHKFCFECSNAPHPPIDCQMLKNWNIKTKREGEDAKWMASFTKECPNCSHLIHKDGGCQYMTCISCKHKFCWICCAAFDHKKHACNQFKEDRKIDPNSERGQMNKFVFFNGRFNIHDQSSKLEDKLLEIAERRMNELADQGMSWIDVQFLKKSTYALMEARNILKYTYVYGYYLPSYVNREVFEFLQGDLEEATEVLSGMLEAPDVDRIGIINQSEYLKGRIEKLIQGLAENDIIGGSAHTEKEYDVVEKYDGWIYNVN